MSDYWFIHKDNHKFYFRTKIYQTKKSTNPRLAYDLILEILKEVIATGRISLEDASKSGSLKAQLDKLWVDCTEEQQLDLAQKLPDAALERNKKKMQNLRVKDEIESVKRKLSDYVVEKPSMASRIVYMDKSDYYNDESRNGLLLYVSKHPRECYVVHSEEDLNMALAEKTDTDNVTLVLSSDNNRKDGMFLHWHLETAGKGIGELIEAHPCIEHLRLISCATGSPNLEYMATHTPKEEKKSRGDNLSNRVLFVRENKSETALPYANDTMAAEIWLTIMSHDSNREFSISASPTYLHLDNQAHPTKFIGSSVGAPTGVNHHFAEDAPSWEQFKSITFSTLDGVKAEKYRARKIRTESPSGVESGIEESEAESGMEFKRRFSMTMSDLFQDAEEDEIPLMHPNRQSKL